MFPYSNENWSFGIRVASPYYNLQLYLCIYIYLLRIVVPCLVLCIIILNCRRENYPSYLDNDDDDDDNSNNNVRLLCVLYGADDRFIIVRLGHHPPDLARVPPPPSKDNTPRRRLFSRSARHPQHETTHRINHKSCTKYTRNCMPHTTIYCYERFME